MQFKAIFMVMLSMTLITSLHSTRISVLQDQLKTLNNKISRQSILQEDYENKFDNYLTNKKNCKKKVYSYRFNES